MTTTTVSSGTRMTLEEFFELPDTEQRRELHEGVLFVVAPPIPDHQQLTKWLNRFLSDQLEDTGLAYVFLPVDVVLSDDTNVEPDIVVVRFERAHVVHRARIHGPPDIVVEALSSNRNRDLVEKRRLYERAGVPEYWLLDGDADNLTQLALDDNGVYQERAVLTAADILTTPLFPSLSLPLEQLFNHPARIRQ